MNNRTVIPTLEDVSTLVSRAFPRLRVASFELLTGGLINTNLKVYFDSGTQPVVLRLYRDGASVCSKEVALLQLVRESVAVPNIYHAEPEGLDSFGAFVLLEFIDGLTFQELKRTNDLEAIHQAAASVGQTLAAIGRYQFPKPGRLAAKKAEGGLTVGDSYVEGPHPTASILDMFLTSPNFERRAGAALARRLHDFVWSWEPRLPNLNDDQRLVHSDFGNRNLIVHEHQGKWVVAAVIDWEFAFSGSPLLDVGNFLRYELTAQPLREPFFSRAFLEHGGQLPEDWRHIVRVIDLTALVECLTHEVLPAEVEIELLQLIHATLEAGEGILDF